MSQIDPIMQVTHTQEKKAYEYYAKAILETLLPEKYHGLYMGECPDIRTPDGRGIEVTRAFYPGEGEALGMLNTYANRPKSAIKPKTMEAIEKKGILLGEDEGRIVTAHLQCGHFISSSVLEHAYQSKIEKYEHYKEMKSVDLFIYEPPGIGLDECFIIDFFETIDEKNPYESIMVLSDVEDPNNPTQYCPLLYCYDTQAKKYKKLIMSIIERDRCKKATQAYVGYMQ